MDTIDILVGKVGRAHGIRGDVTIDVRTDEPERRFAIGRRFTTPRGPLTVSASRWHGVRLLVTFEEIGDRAAAEALRGVELHIDVPADERPDDPEEFYDHQLVGMLVVTESGADVGEVVEVVHLPAQDTLVVRRPAGTGETLVPFVSELVPVVDLAARRLTVVERPGLLTDEPET